MDNASAHPENETTTAVSGSGLDARTVALDLIADVLKRNRQLDDALDAHEGLRNLPGRDRGFARLLAATVLRQKGQLDDLIDKVADQKANDLRPRDLLDLLRLGAAQLVFLETPPHAAVDTTVRMAERRGLSRQKGLVNAIMRRLADKAQVIAGKQDAVMLNFPGWLLDMMTAAYGSQLTRQIAEASLAEAPLDITLKNTDEAAMWAERLEATQLPNGSLRRMQGGLVSTLPGFSQGAWWVQDVAATLPVRLILNGLGDVAGKTVIDMCAAPGGKTAQLAAAGAQVIAVDRAARRVSRLRENMDRLGLSVATEIADGAIWQPREQADAVLLDAPCSATGTIRRHPDLLHLKEPQDVTKLAALQTRLLDNAANMVKPGGLLVYCTCSLLPEEGEAQIDAFLARNAEYERVPVTPEDIAAMPLAIDAVGQLRCFPFHLAAHGGMDGFFIARLRRLV